MFSRITIIMWNRFRSLITGGIVIGGSYYCFSNLNLTSVCQSDSKKLELSSTFASTNKLHRRKDVCEYFTYIDKILEGTLSEKEEAYLSLIQKQPELESDSEYLWRLSKASYTMSGIEAGRNNQDRKKQLIYDANNYATLALEMDKENSNIHKWCAITLSDMGQYIGTKEKIANGYIIRNHIDQSIKLDASDYSVHHLLGRWCYEVYMLSWIERKLATALFATPPNATLEDALSAFYESERLNPQKYITNMLYIAKCYIEKGNYIEALKWLTYASQIEAITTEDECSLDEVNKLKTKYFANLH